MPLSCQAGLFCTVSALSFRVVSLRGSNEITISFHVVAAISSSSSTVSRSSDSWIRSSFTAVYLFVPHSWVQNGRPWLYSWPISHRPNLHFHKLEGHSTHSLECIPSTMAKQLQHGDPRVRRKVEQPLPCNAKFDRSGETAWACVAVFQNCLRNPSHWQCAQNLNNLSLAQTDTFSAFSWFSAGLIVLDSSMISQRTEMPSIVCLFGHF